MKSTAAFFGITFVASWSLFAASAHLSGVGTPGAALAANVVLLLGVFAPALVALALSARSDGTGGRQALLAGLTRWPKQARLWLFATFFMALVKLSAALIHRLVLGTWPPFGADTALGVLGMFAAIVVSTPAQAGEEIGWRGFALPRLAERWGLPAASLILGVVWAAWHIPLFFNPRGDTYRQSFPLYLVGVMALSVILAWLYWRSDGSLLLTMLAHAAINNTKDIVPSTSVPGPNPWHLAASPIAWISAGLLWVIAATLLVRMRGAQLSTARSVQSSQAQLR